MIGLVGCKLLDKDAIKATPRDNLMYLLSLSTLSGSQFWYSLISGPSLIFTIPRIHYAKAEETLAPTFSALATTLSGLVAFVYLKRHPIALWNSSNCTFVSHNIYYKSLSYLFNALCIT